MSQKLNSLINKIKTAREETVKAKSYSEGYLDCIKDILNNEQSDFNKIIEIKYDGTIREDVYNELLPLIEDLEKEFKLEKKNELTSVIETKVESDHPSDRARSFLERIGRI
jgi:hypothetical protein